MIDGLAAHLLRRHVAERANHPGTSASSQSSGDGGTYVVQGKTIQMTWNDGSSSTYELVYEQGAVGALQSGNTWYLRCN